MVGGRVFALDDVFRSLEVERRKTRVWNEGFQSRVFIKFIIEQVYLCWQQQSVFISQFVLKFSKNILRLQSSSQEFTTSNVIWIKYSDPLCQ